MHCDETDPKEVGGQGGGAFRNSALPTDESGRPMTPHHKPNDSIVVQGQTVLQMPSFVLYCVGRDQECLNKQAYRNSDSIL